MVGNYLKFISRYFMQSLQVMGQYDNAPKHCHSDVLYDVIHLKTRSHAFSASRLANDRTTKGPSVCDAVIHAATNVDELFVQTMSCK